MILDSVPPNASLVSILHARAVASSPRRLALDMIVGSLVAAAASWARAFGWITLMCAGLCFACYGLWAFAERALETGPELMSRPTEIVWSVVRVLSAIGGLAALLVMTFSLVSVMLGTWIS